MIDNNFYSRNYIDEYKVAVVCSARSGSTKALGTTTLLLRAASEALQRPTKSAGSGTAIPHSKSMSLFGSYSPPLNPRSRSGSFPLFTSPQPFTTQLGGHAGAKDTVPDFVKTIDLLREEHLSAARASVWDPEILKELEAEIERDCDWLRTFLFAAKVGYLVFLSRSVI